MGNVVDVDLNFEIDPIKGQQEIRKFGYYFNKRGQCRAIETDERFKSMPSEQKQQFDSAIDKFIFFHLREQYNMSQHIFLKGKKREESRMYLSPNYGIKQTLLLLIPDADANRKFAAGQWSQSICIKDNLAAGTMYPFIADAYKRDWGVAIFDSNISKDYSQPYSHDIGGKISNIDKNNKLLVFGFVRETATINIPNEIINYCAVCAFLPINEYNEYIEERYLTKKKDCKIRNIFIICFSGGGMATTHLLNNKTEYLLPRIKGVAGIDSFFGAAQNKDIEIVYKRRIVHWVSSSQPLGTILSNTVPTRVSAGHSAHEYTPAASFTHIFNYFDQLLKMQNRKVQTCSGNSNSAKK